MEPYNRHLEDCWENWLNYHPSIATVDSLKMLAKDCFFAGASEAMNIAMQRPRSIIERMQIVDELMTEIKQYADRVVEDCDAT